MPLRVMGRAILVTGSEPEAVLQAETNQLRAAVWKKRKRDEKGSDSSLAAEGCQQEFLRSRTPSSLSGAARALFVHHLAQKRRGAGASHHLTFNKLTQTLCFITRRGPPIKFTGRGELTAPAVGSGWWSK